MTLVQAMQRSPPTTTPNTTLRSAAKQMAGSRAMLLPVVGGVRLVGTLSAFDLVARTIGGGLDADRHTVRDVMRPDPPTCRPEDTLSQVREQMRALRAPALPVVEADGQLVGLVELFDVENAAHDGMAAGPEPEHVKRVRGEAL